MYKIVDLIVKNSFIFKFVIFFYFCVSVQNAKRIKENLVPYMIFNKFQAMSLIWLLCAFD